MAASDDLTERLLIRDEGFRRSCYQDSLGYWTLGIGRCVDARKGGGISQSEAFLLLRNDLGSKTSALDATIPWWKGLDPVRRAVILSMAYQMGAAGLLGFRNTLKAVQEGRFSDAATLMLTSKWATQVPLRASRLADAMRTGSEGAFQLDEDPPGRF
jgi:lysozyme